MSEILRGKQIPTELMELPTLYERSVTSIERLRCVLCLGRGKFTDGSRVDGTYKAWYCGVCNGTGLRTAP